ncbi:MAG TPA: hypothetical protein VFC63_03670, partial [Blastocatellia bacterium]|nr:hypothetical protein [Blastocatellia bacterium]
AAERIGVRIFPQSIVRATRDRFVIPNKEARFDYTGAAVTSYLNEFTGHGGFDYPLMDDLAGPPGSIIRLQIVGGPGFVSRLRVLNITGKPPY